MLHKTNFTEVDSALNEYLLALQAELGDKLLAVYLLGSLSTDSYLPDWSDVNGVIVVQGDLAELDARVEATQQALLTAHTEWQAMFFTHCLSIDTLKNTSWKNHPPNWGLIDLTNLVEDGKLIWGKEIRNELERPNLEALRAYLIWELVKRLESSLHTPGASRTSLPLRVPTSTEWDYYRQHPAQIIDWLIYPARILLAWDKGRIGSKTEAVNHYIEEYHGPWEPVLLQADTLRRTDNPTILTPETLIFFAQQTISLFEWLIKRLLSILLLPDDLTEAAHNFRRWLERDPDLARPHTGAPYDTFVPGSLGERISPLESEQSDPSSEIFVPKRKPWLNKP